MKQSLVVISMVAIIYLMVNMVLSSMVADHVRKAQCTEKDDANSAFSIAVWNAVIAACLIVAIAAGIGYTMYKKK